MPLDLMLASRYHHCLGSREDKTKIYHTHLISRQASKSDIENPQSHWYQTFMYTTSNLQSQRDKVQTLTDRPSNIIHIVSGPVEDDAFLSEVCRICRVPEVPTPKLIFCFALVP
jgi:hypothetical protein